MHRQRTKWNNRIIFNTLFLSVVLKASIQFSPQADDNEFTVVKWNNQSDYFTLYWIRYINGQYHYSMILYRCTLMYITFRLGVDNRTLANNSKPSDNKQIFALTPLQKIQSWVNTWLAWKKLICCGV